MSKIVPTIAGSFNLKQYQHLKRMYKIAVDSQLTEFSFYDKPMLTTFAKYLLEFLKPHFDHIK